MKKIINNYSTKNALEIKDLDETNRSVAIYLAAFNNVDSDNDVIKKGAFTKSIKERGIDTETNRKIAFLRYHDWEHPIGKFTELYEDEKGLFAVAKLGNSTKGQDAWNDYNDGIIREHSIGFQYVEDKVNWIEDKSMDKEGFWEVKEVKLYEGSAVTFGSNSMTPTVSVIKQEEKVDRSVKIMKQIDTVTKAICNGQGTDERLYELEMKLKYLHNELLILIQHEPFDVKHSVKSEPLVVNKYDWNTVINNVKFN